MRTKLSSRVLLAAAALVATINFDAGEPAMANGAISPLTSPDPTANISVFLATGAGTRADLVLDVTGYFQ